MTELGTVDVLREDDVVRAHRTTRAVAAQLGFSSFEQTRISTAMAEIARNSLIYGGGGSVQLSIDESTDSLEIIVVDHGPGIADAAAALRGEQREGNALGLGIPGARRLMDALNIESSPQGTRVVMRKRLPRRSMSVNNAKVGRLRMHVAEHLASDPHQELRRLQRDVVERDNRIADLAQELNETNLGVMALYAELEERADFQRQAAELKTRLLSEMGHEVRTPLHSILSVAQFLIDRLDGELNEEQDKQVRLIHGVAVSLTEYVNDLLALTRVESGKTPLFVSSISVDRLFATVRRIMQPLANNPGVELTFRAQASLGPIVTDEAKLSQILRNLVANALKFTDRGFVRVSAEAMPNGVAILVEDSGIGIAPEHFDLIFQEFAQVEGPHQQRVRGSGLGLALSRRLAELLGGELSVTSALGRGSRFRLELPIECRSSSSVFPAKIQPAEVVAAKPAPGKSRVLAIDDDEASRYILRRWLGDRFLVEEASGGQEGIRRTIETVPDAIFLDVVMNDLTGFEVLDILAANPITADIPVIVYTSLSLGTADQQRLSRARAIVRKSTASRATDRAAFEQALVDAGLATSLERKSD